MHRTRKTSIFVAMIWLLYVPQAHAQEFSDPLVQKLNDFLPTYTPFTPPEPPDRYFPDEVGKKIADAIVNLYLQNPDVVEQRIRELAQHDATLISQGERPTGVTPYVQALLAPPIREEDKDDRNLVDLSGSPDQLLTEADRLLAEAKRSRIGRRFNWVLSTFDIGSLLLGAPRGPNPASAQGVVSDWNSSSGPGPRERKALVLYREFLNQAPEDSRVPEVQEKVQDLESRRRSALLEAELARAQAAFKKEDYWGANFHYQLALMIDDTSEKAQSGIARVERELQKEEPLAQAQLQDPLAGIKEAEWEHGKQTLTYLLPGSGFVKDNFVVAGTQIATEGLVGAATFGALTIIQTTAKLFQLLTGNPVSRQPVITEAEKYLHNTPSEERDPEVYETLANAYEKEGQLEKAIAYYKLAGQEDRVPRLQERAGDALLELAKQSEHQTQKESYLRTLLAHYPQTNAARKAAAQLRELSLPENRGLQLSKAFLRENRDLIGPQGLSLKPALLDDDIDNVELADDGVTLLPSGEVALRLLSDQGPRTKIYGVPEVAWERFWRRFREKGYEQAAEHDDQGLALLAQGMEMADTTLTSQYEKNEKTGWKMLPYLSGSLGSGFDVRGTLPKEIAGTRLTFGKDQRSSYVGVEVPMPFVPVDFMLLGRNGVPSLYPKIRLPEKALKDEELYR
jgi:tetratricopeptide (TPR) repeat protein